MSHTCADSPYGNALGYAGNNGGSFWPGFLCPRVPGSEGTFPKLTHERLGEGFWGRAKPTSLNDHNADASTVQFPISFATFVEHLPGGLLNHPQTQVVEKWVKRAKAYVAQCD